MSEEFTNSDVARECDFLYEAPATMLSLPLNPCNITFHSEHGAVGELNWADGIMRFTGDADESAKAFFAGFAGYFQQQTQDDLTRLRAKIELLIVELQNIADANPAKWEPDMRDQFLQWAKSRARHAIDAAKEKP